MNLIELDKQLREQTGLGWKELRGRRVNVKTGADNLLPGVFLGACVGRHADDPAHCLVNVVGIEVSYRLTPDDLVFEQPRKLHVDEVEFEETTDEEDISPMGAFSTDDEERDRQDERELIDRLNRGDNSAWCILVVRAKWQGFTGYASLGGFSFPAGNSGPQNAEYAREEYEQLREDALDALNAEIKEVAAKLTPLLT